MSWFLPQTSTKTRPQRLWPGRPKPRLQVPARLQYQLQLRPQPLFSSPSPCQAWRTLWSPLEQHIQAQLQLSNPESQIQLRMQIHLFNLSIQGKAPSRLPRNQRTLFQSSRPRQPLSSLPLTSQQRTEHTYRPSPFSACKIFRLP